MPARAGRALHERGDAPLVPGPLYRPREPGGPGAEAEAERPCGAGCVRGFDPIGWLSGWLARIAPEDAAASAPSGPGETEAGAGTATVTPAPPASPSPAAPQDRSGAPAAMAEGASASPLPGEAAPAASAADDGALRSAEVIGRIWIAPFVDADGHYREGSWVRTVLEPAGWRTP